jgi:hypothetical protein
MHVPVVAAAAASGLLTTTLQLGQAVGVATFGSLFLTLATHPVLDASGHALAVTMYWVAEVLALGGPVPQDQALVDVEGLVREGHGAVPVMVGRDRPLQERSGHGGDGQGLGRSRRRDEGAARRPRHDPGRPRATIAPGAHDDPRAAVQQRPAPPQQPASPPCPRHSAGRPVIFRPSPKVSPPATPTPTTQCWPN